MGLQKPRREGGDGQCGWMLVSEMKQKQKLSNEFGA